MTASIIFTIMLYFLTVENPKITKRHTNCLAVHPTLTGRHH